MTAAVVLKTGLPGCGKTLSMVEELAAMRVSWDKDPASERPLYVHGIADLTIRHKRLPVYPLEVVETDADGRKWTRPGTSSDLPPLDKNGQPEGECAVDWSLVPDGSVCVIDEAHKVFPRRAPSQKIPPHVAWFATVRHNDCLVYLMTQGPKALDLDLKIRIGKHQHYKVNAMTALLGKRSTVYEWSEVSERLTPRSAEHVRVWKWPRQVFGMYRSAQGFTGGASHAVNWALFVPIAVAVIALAGAGWAFSTWYKSRSADLLFRRSAAAPVAASAPGQALIPPVAPKVVAAAASAVPLPPAMAASAAGCLSMRGRCRCIDAGGYVVDYPLARCVVASREYGSDIPYPVARLNDFQTVAWRPLSDVQPVSVGASAASAPGGFAPPEVSRRH